MRILLLILLLLSPLTLHAPILEVIPAWHYVSFDIQENRIITEHGSYSFEKLPAGFLVLERKRKNYYEIRIKKFERRYVK